MILREEKGYTYGARTGFSGGKVPGTFTASSSVRTNTTGESVQIFKDQIGQYKNGISEEDLEFTKNDDHENLIHAISFFLNTTHLF